VSILGDILRAPASSPGTSSSLGGDLVQFGAQLFGNWTNSKSEARRAKAQAKAQARAARGYTSAGFDAYIPPNYNAVPQHGGGYQYQGSGAGMSILDGSVSPSQVPMTYSQAPYVEAGYTNASWPGATNANMLALGGAAAGAAVTVTRAAAQRLAAWLVRALPTLGTAGAIQLAVDMIGSGVAGGADGPYANPKHNKVTGVMRGDVIALRRVKRSAKRLQKVLRMAGVGGRRSAGRFRRRRAC